MSYRAEPKKPRTKRHPLWDIEFLKDQLRSSSATLTEICKSYAPSPDKWKALYFDVQRWKETDSELRDILEAHRIRTDSKKRKTVSGGRPRKDQDPEHHDWRVKFCEELLRTKSRSKAALVTPYSHDEVYMMLHEKYSTYDKDFAEMVHLTEMKMVAWAEETMWTSLDEAKNPKDKAWIAKEILKVRDRPRWGDKLDVSVNATVNHLLPEQRQKLLAELAEDQSKFFGTVKLKELPANIKESVPMDFLAKKDNIIDAEVIEDAADTNVT